MFQKITMVKFKKKLNIKNIYILGIFILILSFYKTPLNFYVILKNDYNSRIVKSAGYCDNQGYGFLKYIYQKYEMIYPHNYDVINYNNSASANSYFYNIKKNKNANLVILLNPSKKDMQSFFLQKHKMIEKVDNCFFLELK